MTSAASYGQRARLAGPRSQRRRLIASMTVLSADCGRRGLSVEKACDHAGVSKTKFYELFDDLDDCIAAAVEDAHEALWTVVERAIESLPPGEWARTVSAAIVGFLAALEANPTAAWLCVVEPLNGVPRARAARRQLIERLASLIPADVDRAPTPTAPGSIGALWELARQHRTGQGETRGLTDLTGSAIFLVLAPYIGRRAAAKHAATTPSVPVSVPERHATDPLVCGLTELARSTLLFLDDRPGTSNAEIGIAVGVTHASQMSRHLRRLEGEGLVVGARDGRRNAWALTVLGTETVTQLRG